jgi:hypothetical protein
MKSNPPTHKSIHFTLLLVSAFVLAVLAVFVWMVFEVWHPMPPRLLDFPRADTYVALYPYLDKVVVPSGLADLARNLPLALYTRALWLGNAAPDLPAVRGTEFP